MANKRGFKILCMDLHCSFLQIENIKNDIANYYGTKFNIINRNKIIRYGGTPDTIYLFFHLTTQGQF